VRLQRALWAALGVAMSGLLLWTVPASAATVQGQWHQPGLRGTTAVTTAPGIAGTLVGAGVLPLPVPPTRFRTSFSGGLTVTYGFPITSGNPTLSPPGGDILHSGGIDFVSLRGKHLGIGKFDIALAAGKIYATQVNFTAARIPVLDLDLSGLKVAHDGRVTVLSGITLRLDPAAAGALNTTFGLSLPADGSLVFGTATVTLRA
jgi:hypothetical protein